MFSPENKYFLNRHILWIIILCDDWTKHSCHCHASAPKKILADSQENAINNYILRHHWGLQLWHANSIGYEDTFSCGSEPTKNGINQKDTFSSKQSHYRNNSDKWSAYCKPPARQHRIGITNSMITIAFRAQTHRFATNSGESKINCFARISVNFDVEAVLEYNSLLLFVHEMPNPRWSSETASLPDESLLSTSLQIKKTRTAKIKRQELAETIGTSTRLMDEQHTFHQLHPHICCNKPKQKYNTTNNKVTRKSTQVCNSNF